MLRRVCSGFLTCNNHEDGVREYDRDGDRLLLDARLISLGNERNMSGKEQRSQGGVPDEVIEQVLSPGSCLVSDGELLHRKCSETLRAHGSPREVLQIPADPRYVTHQGRSPASLWVGKGRRKVTKTRGGILTSSPCR